MLPYPTSWDNMGLLYDQDIWDSHRMLPHPTTRTDWVFGITRMHGAMVMCLAYQTRYLTNNTINTVKVAKPILEMDDSEVSSL